LASFAKVTRNQPHLEKSGRHGGFGDEGKHLTRATISAIGHERTRVTGFDILINPNRNRVGPEETPWTPNHPPKEGAVKIAQVERKVTYTGPERNEETGEAIQENRSRPVSIKKGQDQPGGEGGRGVK